MTRIRLESIHKTFGTTVAVEGVSLEIASGELFFLLGPSGCGKTTLLRILAGFCEPTAGKAHFNDTCINDVPPQRRNTGMVFQSYALWPHMTVAQNVVYGLEVRGMDRAERQRRVERVLELVGMTEYAERRPAQLSGGQQQRVAVARALVVEPDVLLLDEPLSNLDAKLRTEMREEIRRIHDETKITTVYVTHDQDEALSLADRMAILDAGRLQQIGTPLEIYHRPASRFVAGFIGETNLLEGELVRVGNSQTAHVRTALGEFVCRAGEGAGAPGQRVTCSVRPEGLRLAGADATNTFTARLDKEVFIGGVHHLSLSGGDNGAVALRMKMLAGPDVPTKPGTTLRLQAAPESVVVLTS